MKHLSPLLFILAASCWLAGYLLIPRNPDAGEAYFIVYKIPLCTWLPILFVKDCITGTLHNISNIIMVKHRAETSFHSDLRKATNTTALETATACILAVNTAIAIPLWLLNESDRTAWCLILYIGFCAASIFSFRFHLKHLAAKELLHYKTTTNSQ